MKKKLFYTTFLSLFTLHQVEAATPNALQFSSKPFSSINFVQRSCNLEVQFNKDDNKLTSPPQEANLDKKLPIMCTWYNVRPLTNITEDAGMQTTIWLQNDPTNPVNYVEVNKLKQINLHCLFEPATNGLGGKRRVDRSGGIDYISGVMVSKSGDYKSVYYPLNGNLSSSILDAKTRPLAKENYVISNSKDPAHLFNQEIDIKVSNYASFWDTQTDPQKTSHPSYSQVNIVFQLNGEDPGRNKDNALWPDKKNIFNDGDKLTCDIWLPDHYIGN